MIYYIIILSFFSLYMLLLIDFFVSYTIGWVVYYSVNLPKHIAVSGNIGCTNPTVTLNGTSTTANVTYLWSGPGGFSSPLQNPTTSVTGQYTVQVTGANGCTKTAQVDVNGSTTLPDATATGGTLTCANPQIQINGNSNTPNVTWSWTGPGGPYSLQNPFVNQPGTYQ